MRFTYGGNGTTARLAHESDGRGYDKRARTPKGDFDRLFQAMRFSRRVLERYRRERYEAVRQYVGSHYSDGGTDLENPVNLIARYLQIIPRFLIPKCPRVDLSTRKRSAMPAVSAMKDWMNVWLEKVHFEMASQRAVVDALFAFGVMKVALGTPADAAGWGYTAKSGVPFAETVDLDDWVCDLGARDQGQYSFVGHRFRIPREVAEELGYFDRKARKDLSGAVTPYGMQTNQEGDSRIDMIGKGFSWTGVRDYEELVDLWEVYLPRTKRILTFASASGGVPDEGTNPLRDQEWLGPDCGPYHYLNLMPRPPGNPLAPGPISYFMDLHTGVNRGYRKLIDQMGREKEVLPVRGGQVDDANALVQASDGEAFACDNADSIKAIRYGGPSQQNAVFVTHLMDVFNKLAGNLDVLSGGGPQSKTATQDKLLSENASSGVTDMQESTVEFLSSALTSVAWYWWYHPTQVMEATYKVKGLPDMDYERKLQPASAEEGLKRSGAFDQLMIRVDPYSLKNRTPAQRLQFIMGLVDKFIPMTPVLAQQGIRIDFQALMKTIAEYADEPLVETIFTVGDPIEPQGSQGDGGGMSLPSSTERNYTRQSVGQDTEANRFQEMSNAARQEGAEGE